MSKVKLYDTFSKDCPVRNILSRVSDKWSLLVLYTLNNEGVVRFKELKNLLPDISQKMLTVTLRTLEEDGFVIRTPYPTIPPKVEYSLTPRATSFITHLQPLIDWAKGNMEDILADRKRSFNS